MVLGIKRFEARSWVPHWRGRVAVHASSAPVAKAVWEETVADAAVARALKKAGLASYGDVRSLPRRAIVGAVTIHDVRAGRDWPAWSCTQLDRELSSQHGCALLWRLKDPIAFEPVAGIDGKLNLWTLGGALAQRIITAAGRGAWGGGPHDDAGARDAAADCMVREEDAWKRMDTPVPVPAVLRGALARRSIRPLEAFDVLRQELLALPGAGRSLTLGDQVAVAGPVLRSLVPNRRKIEVHQALVALLRLLIPDGPSPDDLILIGLQRHV